MVLLLIYSRSHTVLAVAVIHHIIYNKCMTLAIDEDMVVLLGARWYQGF
jgi:hypothetical protein